MRLYTACVYGKYIVERTDVPYLDITVKSGDRVFAPTWDILMSYKSSKDEGVYTKAFLELMRESYVVNKERWLEVLNSDSIAIACYCHRGTFCHRYLLVEVFEKIANHLKIEFEYKGEIY